MLRPQPRPRPHLEVVPSSGEERDFLPLSARAFMLLCAGAITMGFLLRAAFVAGSSFPLNDGGMFYQMTRDLQAHGYALPSTTSYNQAGIPFGYPPLGFYLTGLLDDLTPLSLLDAYRVAPLLAATALMVAFVLMAREFLRTRAEPLIALVVFATLAPTFRWMIMGGGVTRAPGFVFALLAIREVSVMYTSRSRWRAASAGVLAGLTLLSHLEMAWFAAIVCGLLFVAHGRDRNGVVLSAIVSAGALLVSAPWWATVTAQHGPGPLLSAAGSGSPSLVAAIIHLLQFGVTAEPLFTLIAALAILGLLTCVARRQYMLPAWILAVGLLDPRAFPTSASPAVAMLAAIAVSRVLVPLLHHGGEVGPGDRKPAASWLVPALLASATVYAFLGAMLSAPHRLQGMSVDERTAMTWVTEHTPSDARFAIVSGDVWPLDRTAEWFPALTQRRSVATVQGYEWVDAEFRPKIDAYTDLQHCAVAGASCIDQWADDTTEDFEYIYIPKLAPRKDRTIGKDCCASLIASLREDERYPVVYDGAGAVIFERR
ncbi:MAG TPA: hypothetical protein VFH62_04520 [Dehalococcoidia bacterium]|nr:hypothetical protein [Dehalococcoidia bacterium]